MKALNKKKRENYKIIYLKNKQEDQQNIVFVGLFYNN